MRRISCLAPAEKGPLPKRATIAKTAGVSAHPASFPADSLAAGLAAALDWWRDAGLDYDFQDDPRDWLPIEEAAGEVLEPIHPALAKPIATPEEQRPQMGGPRETWPQSLADFTPWWMGEPSLDQGLTHERVPPRGPAHAKLMVLVAHPEAEDAAAGRLLAGAQGKLLSSILPVLGLAEEEVYVGSVLPRAMPSPDWAGLLTQGIGPVLTHHIALAAPQRLLVLGQSILSLLGHEPAQKTAKLRLSVGQGQPEQLIEVLASYDLGVMLEYASRKRGLWQAWLDWTGRE
jgi:uracil-DNA glycosylase family 4